MDSNEELALNLTLEECKSLFSRLKREEASLSFGESHVLQKIEKMLYSRLSIGEIEDLYD